MTPSQPSGKHFPVGRWLRLHAPGFTDFVGFTYIDPEAGLSAQGDAALPGGERSRVIVRLPLGDDPWEELGLAELAERGLPARPEWLKEYGPQPTPGTRWGWWRDHPHLSGKFLPGYPDDLQVLVHEGGPRTAKNPPELMWVRVVGGEGDVFTGRLLNAPHQLKSVALNDEIRFIVPQGAQHPLRVTEQYLRERPDWVIEPCNRCGYGELLDPPSELIRVVFPNTPPDATMSAFTAKCGNCGGFLMVKHRQAAGEAGPQAEAARPEPAERKWWQVWK